MNKQKYKIGNIVILNSGGPNMTINSINEDLEENKYVFNGTYDCIWFDNYTRHEATFKEETISIVKDNT